MTQHTSPAIGKSDTKLLLKISDHLEMTMEYRVAKYPYFEQTNIFKPSTKLLGTIRCKFNYF